MLHQDYRGIPAVSRLLEAPVLLNAAESYGRPLLLMLTRAVLDEIRAEIDAGAAAPPFDGVLSRIQNTVDSVTGSGLRRVINATGVLLHTNLGRAPLGRSILEEVIPVLAGYSNLEFRLDTGERGRRMEHLAPLLRLATGADDAIAVNNNAAAVLLTLQTFAKGKEVLTSRGELIEIGGSFRMPDIIEASGARLVEVGTTNRTRLADYERAITPDTAVILKSHCSNFEITGFSEDTSVRDLAHLAKARDVLLLHDIGSGLLNETADPALLHEPDVRGSLAAGSDLVMFSCDKLLGGPQAGVIAGRSDLIQTIASQPLLRALRLDKVTIALLHATVLNRFRSEEQRSSDTPGIVPHRSTGQLHAMAEHLAQLLAERDILCEVVASRGCFGGGSIPGRDIGSFAVRIESNGGTLTADGLMDRLRQHIIPVIAVPKKGRVCLDVLAMFDHDLEVIADALGTILCDI